MAFIGPIASAVGSILGTTVVGTITVGQIVGFGLSLGAIFLGGKKPKAAFTSGGSAISASQSYGFNGEFANSSGRNEPVGVAYGTVKHAGDIIHHNISGVSAEKSLIMDMIVSLGEGEIDDNGSPAGDDIEITVNGISWADLTGSNSYSFYSGAASQSVDDRSNPLWFTHPIGKEIKAAQTKKLTPTFVRTIIESGDTGSSTVAETAQAAGPTNRKRIVLGFDSGEWNSSWESLKGRLIIKMIDNNSTAQVDLQVARSESGHTPTAGATWSTYDGSNSWTTAGGGPGGNEVENSGTTNRYETTDVGGTRVFVLGTSTVKDMFANSQGLIVYGATNGEDMEFDTDGIYLEVEYHNKTVTADNPTHTFKTYSDGVTGVKLYIKFPRGLYELSDSGYAETLFFYKLSYRLLPAGSWTQTSKNKMRINRPSSFYIEEEVLSGATAGQYEIKFEILVDEFYSTNPPTSSDSTSRIQEAYLEFWNETDGTSRSFPSTAYVAMTLEATEQISGSIPTIAIQYKGRNVRVYTSTTSYSETWSDNPAWCLLDWITSGRYGGGKSHDDIDIQDFLDAADFCDDESLTINGVMKSERNFVDSLSSFLEVFRASVYQSDKLRLVWDEGVSTATQAFTTDNILMSSGGRGSTFKVWRTPSAELPNRAIASYRDEDRGYETAEAVYDYPDAIETDGDVRELKLDFELVSSETQALALSEFYLKRERLCDVFCEFEVTYDAMAVTIGDLVTVTRDELAWSSKQFKVIGIEEIPETFRAKLTLREYDSSIY